MMLSEQDHNLIEQYLLGNLSDEELQNFQNRLQTDKNFAEELRFMSGIVKGVRRAGREELKAHLKNLTEEINYAPRQISLLKIVSIAASFIVIVGLGYFFWPKTGKAIVTAEALNKTAAPFTAIKIPVKTIAIKESAQVLKLNNTVRLSVPASAFVDDKGQPVANVRLTFADLNHPVDQFLEGIPTAIDSGNKIKMLVPETMLAITVTAFKEVKVDTHLPLNVILPATDTSTTRSVFKLDTLSKTWIAMGSDALINMEKYSTVSDADLLVPRLENTKKERFKILVSDEKFPELAIYKNYIFEIAPEEKNFNPSDDQQIWSSIVVEKNGKGKPYKVTFKNDVKTVTYLANPVFAKQDYAQAMKTYQEKLRDYEKKNLLGEDLKRYELAKVIRNNNIAGQYFRVFEITSSGIYASTRLTEISENLTYTVKLNDADGRELNIAQIAVADFSKNTLQRIKAGPKVTIQIDNPNNKAILAITSDNQFAYLTREQFKNTFNQTDLKTIRLNIFNEKGDYQKLKSLFNPVELSLIDSFLKKYQKKYN